MKDARRAAVAARRPAALALARTEKSEKVDNRHTTSPAFDGPSLLGTDQHSCIRVVVCEFFQECGKSRVCVPCGCPTTIFDHNHPGDLLAFLPHPRE